MNNFEIFFKVQTENCKCNEEKEIISNSKCNIDTCGSVWMARWGGGKRMKVFGNWKN